jgi:hypothetical protein
MEQIDDMRHALLLRQAQAVPPNLELVGVLNLPLNKSIILLDDYSVKSITALTQTFCIPPHPFLRIGR